MNTEEEAKQTLSRIPILGLRILLLLIIYPIGFLTLISALLMSVKGMYCLVKDSHIYENCEEDVLFPETWNLYMLYCMLSSHILLIAVSFLYVVLMKNNEVINYVNGRPRRWIFERNSLYHEIPLHGTAIISILLSWIIFFADMKRVDLPVLVTVGIVLQNLYVTYIAPIDLLIPKDHYYEYNRLYNAVSVSHRAWFNDYRMMMAIIVTPVLLILTIYNLLLAVYDIFTYARITALGNLLYSNDLVLILSILGRLITAYLRYIIALFCWHKTMKGDSNPLTVPDSYWRQKMNIGRIEEGNSTILQEEDVIYNRG